MARKVTFKALCSVCISSCIGVIIGALIMREARLLIVIFPFVAGSFLLYFAGTKEVEE